MYAQNPKVRDAQNPYRTGVLVGNYTEDKFGTDHAANPVSESTTNHLHDIENRRNWFL
jgi:hypothetical protein